jgi:hypothetical protein
MRAVEIDSEVEISLSYEYFILIFGTSHMILHRFASKASYPFREPRTKPREAECRAYLRIAPL